VLCSQLPLIRATVSITQAMGGLLGASEGDARRFLFGFDDKGGAFVVHRGDQAGDLLEVRGGRLRARNTEHQARVTATIERAAGLGRQTSTILVDDDSGWWLFSVAPAPIAGASAMTSFSAWAALVPYQRSEAADLGRVRHFASVFGLSPAEARVAGLIGEARTIHATARALATSPGTVRNHLKAIFAKIGISRQAELVAILSRF